MKTDNIKRFAVEARNKIISQVEDALIRLGYNYETGSFAEEPQAVEGGYTFQGKIHNDATGTFMRQWGDLVAALRCHSVADLIEEVAYTWFNRVLAIKILGENGYIEPILNPLSAQISTPLLISNAKNGNVPKLTKTEQERFDHLIFDETQESALFSLLFVAYCRNYPLISRVFGAIDDYKQLLIPDLLGTNGLVTALQQTDAITADDYQQVELIGWLYQFYISEKKDEVFAGFKKKKKADATTIPAATQIFTPNWIVKYMVENTVGQVWLDANVDSTIAADMPYYIQPDASYRPTPIISEAAELKLLDPACGSGHILVEGFNLLMKCYEEEFYEPKEAARAILQHNLFGLDIDLRAAQLARFAVLLIAAKADPEILVDNIIPHIYEMPEASAFDEEGLCYFLGLDANDKASKTDSCLKELSKALELMQQAKVLGSIMKFDISEASINKIQERIKYWHTNTSNDVFNSKSIEELKPFLDVLMVMTQKFEAVVANPPYMGSSNFNNELKKYAVKEYKDSKSDLCTIFIDVCRSFIKSKGFYSMINLPTWMFTSSFVKLRKMVMEENKICSLLHMGRGIFGVDWGSVAFVLKKTPNSNMGSYFRLHENNFQHISVSDIKNIFLSAKKEHSFKFNFDVYDRFNEIEHSESGSKIYFNINQEEFKKISGSPIAYWLSEKMLAVFSENATLFDYGDSRFGMSTANNDKFLRLWNEMNLNRICFNSKNSIEALNSSRKWFPCNKGGSRRKWYGNHEFMVNWENDGYDIKHNIDLTTGKVRSHSYNGKFSFKESISWGLITSGGTSFRYYPNGFIFDTAGVTYFPSNNSNLSMFLGLLNTRLYYLISKIINPTLNLSSGDLAKFPAPPELDLESRKRVEEAVQLSIDISKQDWDAHETSWNFEQNEFLRLKSQVDSTNPNRLESLYTTYCTEWRNTFLQLQSNEEAINKVFIDHYDLNDEISYKVPLEDITILQQGEIKIVDDEIVFQGREIMSQFISYLIGCFMGRYRLDKPGLHIAYSDATSDVLAPYEYNGQLFEIDDDGIIPLMDGSVSFPDNGLNRLKDTLSLLFGAENHVENINFIETQLGKTLDTYLVKEFYKDHCKRYSKRPIYWLFSSPKGAFQVLVYMHRLNEYTADIIRQNYLLPHIGNLQNRIALQEKEADSMTSKENKAFIQLKKDLQECLDYNDVLKEVAEAQIAIDLDDGVVVNYAKYKDVLAKIK